MLSSRSRSPGIASEVTATIGRLGELAPLAHLANDRLAAAARDLHVEQQQIGALRSRAAARASSTVAASTTSCPRSSRMSWMSRRLSGLSSTMRMRARARTQYPDIPRFSPCVARAGPVPWPQGDGSADCGVPLDELRTQGVGPSARQRRLAQSGLRTTSGAMRLKSRSAVRSSRTPFSKGQRRDSRVMNLASPDAACLHQAGQHRPVAVFLREQAKSGRLAPGLQLRDGGIRWASGP